MPNHSAVLLRGAAAADTAHRSIHLSSQLHSTASTLHLAYTAPCLRWSATVMSRSQIVGIARARAGDQSHNRCHRHLVAHHVCTCRRLGAMPAAHRSLSSLRAATLPTTDPWTWVQSPTSASLTCLLCCTSYHLDDVSSPIPCFATLSHSHQGPAIVVWTLQLCIIVLRTLFNVSPSPQSSALAL
jgi:hypothetical protein